MNLKLLFKRAIGFLFAIGGIFFVYMFAAVLPAIDCTEVWSDGKLIQNICQPIYYDIASYAISGEIVGWVMFAFGTTLFLIGIWIVWRTTKTLPSDSGHSDEY